MTYLDLQWWGSLCKDDPEDLNVEFPGDPKSLCKPCYETWKNLEYKADCLFLVCSSKMLNWEESFILKEAYMRVGCSNLIAIKVLSLGSKGLIWKRQL